MTEQTVNANVAECIKSVESFGSTAYHNICNGAVSVLPWGLERWFAAGIVTIGAAGVLYLIWLSVTHR